ncbi:MAG: single-stranded DNA-binding protein [Cyclobacteriaceae bacterium]|jgi:single-strand DNA-binding protein|tara:strand:+ start:504 stop:842 length:339 start_codon:yes stop_codon:yes gene_type:complete
MNTLKNSASIIGNLGNDPEVRTFDSGKKLATFTVATNETFTNNKGEKVTDTQWHNVAVWGKQAENVEKILSKGSFVAVTGKLINRSYEKDGETRYITEIQMSEFLSLDKKQD